MHAFSLPKSLEIMANTPDAVSALLHNLHPDWVTENEGANTWTVKEVVAHLICCEKTNWLPRIRIILTSNPEKRFAPMDMQQHFEMAANTPLPELLKQFKTLRREGIEALKSFELTEADFEKTAMHPVIGVVTLSQLIATLITHDLTHLAQIARILAKQNTELVGSFKTYLSILK